MTSVISLFVSMCINLFSLKCSKEFLSVCAINLLADLNIVWFLYHLTCNSESISIFSGQLFHPSICIDISHLCVNITHSFSASD